MSDRPTLSFQGGTLVITHRPQSDPPGVPFQWLKGKWRCEAYHYPAIPLLDLRDVVPRWRPLDYILDESRQPHDYQQEAIIAWEQAGRRGSIVLPTGAGKTFVAIQAIHRRFRNSIRNGLCLTLLCVLRLPVLVKTAQSGNTRPWVLIARHEPIPWQA